MGSLSYTSLSTSVILARLGVLSDSSLNMIHEKGEWKFRGADLAPLRTGAGKSVPFTPSVQPVPFWAYWNRFSGQELRHEKAPKDSLGAELSRKGCLGGISADYPSTASLHALATLNFTTFFAGIFIAAPV